MLLRSLLRLFAAPKPPQLIPESTPHTLFYARVPRSRASVVARKQAPPMVATCGSHRQRLLSMQLQHTRICSSKRCQRLSALGVVTAGDLLAWDPRRLATHFNAPKKALRMLMQYRRAIRLAASVPGMMPVDAMLLISIHRRSVRGLAAESAATLHRDLMRFSESSQGRAQLRGRRLPSTRRLRKWIHACELISG